MRNKMLISVTTAGLALAGFTLTSGMASAGHSNALLEAALDGRNEVASNASDRRLVGDPDGTGEAYVFGIDGDPNTLCYVLTVEGITELAAAPGNGRAAHIHQGAAGENGPVVANLAFPQGGNAADCLGKDEVLPSGARAFPIDQRTGAPFTTIQEILAHPGDYYVNVHNNEFPGGALRGQLAPQD